MGILQKKIVEKINALLAGYETNKEIIHNGIKGGLNEAELSEIIKSVIPTRYKIAKGIIENSTGQQSNETDLVIYDDEILPPYIKEDLSIIPIEATIKIIEVKSSLNSTELKTTISKFNHYYTMYGRGQSILFAYNSDITGNELSRYKKYDDLFFYNPRVKILCIAEKSFYYLQTTEHYLSDFCTKAEWLEKCAKSANLDIQEKISLELGNLSNSAYLNSLDNANLFESIQRSKYLEDALSKLTSPNSVKTNGLSFEKITFKVHRWIGINQEVKKESNIEILALLANLSNSLSLQNLGSYLFTDQISTLEVLSICFEDQWGNLSGMDYDENGLEYDTKSFTYHYKSRPNTAQPHIITFNCTKT